MTNNEKDLSDKSVSIDREYLIDLCEKSIVNVSERMDRDTPNSQLKVWELRALLKCGLDYTILYKWTLYTNENTILIEVYYPDFSSFEYWFDLKDKKTLSYENFYLPTEKRLKECEWSDRY